MIVANPPCTVLLDSGKECGAETQEIELCMTLVGFGRGPGEHVHDANCFTRTYECSNGHHFDRTRTGAPCPKCGIDWLRDYSFCGACGAPPLREEDVIDEQASTP